MTCRLPFAWKAPLLLGLAAVIWLPHVAAAPGGGPVQDGEFWHHCKPLSTSSGDLFISCQVNQAYYLGESTDPGRLADRVRIVFRIDGSGDNLGDITVDTNVIDGELMGTYRMAFDSPRGSESLRGIVRGPHYGAELVGDERQAEILRLFRHGGSVELGFDLGSAGFDYTLDLDGFDGVWQEAVREYRELSESLQ